MNYFEKFDKYWDERGHYLTIPNKGRILEKFKELYRLADENDGNPIDYIYDVIEGYIINHKAYYMGQVQLDFYDYLLEKKENLKNGSGLDIKKLELTPLERQIDILKNSHGIFKIAELTKLYNVDDKIIRKDIDAIENGLSFMKTLIKPRVKYNGPRREYVDTVHPIFLALNLSEVNALMKFLPELLEKCKDRVENDVEKSELKLILGLITRMKIQLSDYAIEKLDIDIEYSHKELRFISEDETKDKHSDLVYAIKAGKVIRKIIINSVDEYEGYIEFPDDADKTVCKCIIRALDGKKIKVYKDDTISLIDDYEKIGNRIQ